MNIKELKQKLRSLKIDPLRVWEGEAPVVGWLLKEGVNYQNQACFHLYVIFRTQNRKDLDYNEKLLCWNLSPGDLQRILTDTELLSLELDTDRVERHRGRWSALTFLNRTADPFVYRKGVA